MFGGVNYNKLKTNLRLAVGRLKLLEKKKTELAQRSRKEIADFISIDKEDRARIRVEHIIREDYLVESFELLEMFCDLLAARFGLIEQMKTVDEGIEEAISSILWAALRLQTEVPELKVIADQLTAKYGKPFAEACRENKSGKVNAKLVHKLSVNAPPKILVEKYMMEIAKSHNVPFVPDANVTLQDDAANNETMLIALQSRGEMGFGWSGPPNPGGGGVPQQFPGGIPQIPATCAGNAASAGPVVYPLYNQNAAVVNKPFDYPTKQGPPPPSDEYKVPLNDSGQPTAPPAYTTLPPFNHLVDSGQEFPSPPAASTGGKEKEEDEDEDMDFDDLNRRFEELKKKR